MSAETLELKTVRVTEEDIAKLNNILLELQLLYKEYSHRYTIPAIESNKDEFPLLSRWTMNPDFLLTEISKYISHTPFELIFLNLRTLLDNCANQDKQTLDFSPNIKEALSLLDARTKGVFFIEYTNNRRASNKAQQSLLDFIKQLHRASINLSEMDICMRNIRAKVDKVNSSSRCKPIECSFHDHITYRTVHFSAENESFANLSFKEINGHLTVDAIVQL